MFISASKLRFQLLVNVLWLAVPACVGECEVIKVRDAIENADINGYYVLMDYTCEDQSAWKHVQHQQPGTAPSSTPRSYYLGYSRNGGVHGWAITNEFCTENSPELAAVRRFYGSPYNVPAGSWFEYSTSHETAFTAINETQPRAAHAATWEASFMSAICVQDEEYEDYILEYQEHHTLTGGGIAGIVIGCILMCAFVVVMTMWLRHSRPVVVTHSRVVYRPPPPTVTIRII